MKVGKNTKFMLDFINEYLNGEISRENFEMDYSGRVIEYFPKMRRENAAFAQLFADTVDAAYELYADRNLDDEAFQIEINNAVCDWLGVPNDDVLL